MWRIFKKEPTSRILSTYIPQVRKSEDNIVWSRNKTGIINAKDAYSLLMENQRPQGCTTFNKKSGADFGL